MKHSKRDLEIAAQCWCDPKTENEVMVPELAIVFAEALASERRKVLSDPRVKGLFECVESLQHEERLPGAAELARQCIFDFQELLKEAGE